jgi:CRISPR-associated protein Cmr2
MKPGDLRYSDTATIAATRWLADNGIDPNAGPEWSGQWLHWTSRDQDVNDGERKIPENQWRLITVKRREKPVPAYYAVLMLDGDHMGKWLRGEFARKVSECLHPKIVGYFSNLQEAEKGLAALRPFGPALHAALSEALTSFALHFVPDIVARHQGELIYAGGDDVLALLPTPTALSCAVALNATFQRDWAPDPNGRERLLMGHRATVSAGLAIAHYKEDLRVVLRAARDAESEAKRKGRNALCLRIVRRSGEDSSAVLGWESVTPLVELVQDFINDMSDRWAYRLRAELPTLEGLPEMAFRAELTRLLTRLEAKEERREAFRDRVLAFWDSYRQRFQDKPETRRAFVTLCQSAAFLARGRDQ